LLGNTELAERTGLSKSTVSRLTQTLVGTGFLQVDSVTRAYRLAPATLSLAHAMRAGSEILNTALPWMRAAAQSQRINVGLAAPDLDEMVYLESIRYNPRPSLRSVVSGQRVPIESTSLGLAYLSQAREPHRSALLQHLARKHAQHWPVIADHLAQAQASIAQRGWCAASWQAGVVALSAPIRFQDLDYALNVSLTVSEDRDEVIERLARILLDLHAQLQQALRRP
jgi:DNA-binding IclR family transcriptional regulator